MTRFQRRARRVAVPEKSEGLQNAKGRVRVVCETMKAVQAFRGSDQQKQSSQGSVPPRSPTPTGNYQIGISFKKTRTLQTWTKACKGANKQTPSRNNGKVCLFTFSCVLLQPATTYHYKCGYASFQNFWCIVSKGNIWQ